MDTAEPKPSLAKPLLVVNPASARGATEHVFPGMRRRIEKAIGTFDVEFTARRGHAVDLACSAANEGRSLIIAVGGDGTFSEVVNGVMRSQNRETRVGIIGRGTGGDFRRTLGIEHRLESYLDALVSEREQSVDVGHVQYTTADGKKNERYFVNILSAGMGGLCDRYVGESSPYWPGRMAYMVGSLRGLIDCHRGDLLCRVTRLGRVEERRIQTFMIAICNGQYFGSGMHIAPKAELSDGRFDVVAIPGESKAAFLSIAMRVYDGGHIAKPGVDYFGCEKIEIESLDTAEKRPFLLDVDGEPVGQIPMTITLIPRAIVVRG